MVKYCSVYGCNASGFDTVDGISFHKFPENEKLKRAWISRLRRENWVPSSTSYVCSRHFNESDFKVTEKRRRLLATAVPSLYSRSQEGDE